MAQVERIAKLCGLQLSAEEQTKMSHELSKILTHIDRLAELQLDGIEATDHVLLDRMPLRDDVPDTGLDRDRVLAQAPSSDGTGFCVPAFVDEG